VAAAGPAAAVAAAVAGGAVVATAWAEVEEVTVVTAVAVMTSEAVAAAAVAGRALASGIQRASCPHWRPMWKLPPEIAVAERVFALTSPWGGGGGRIGSVELKYSGVGEHD